MQKVNILGTEYKIIFATEKEKPDLKEIEGYADFTVKEIVIKDPEKRERSFDNSKEYSKKVLRHEIIHVFMYESGLWENSAECTAWAENEEMTDWIAIQFPKILKAYQEACCI